MDSEVIKDALIDFIEADANIMNILKGGLWYVENNTEEKDKIFPYGVLNFVGGIYEYDSQTDYADPVFQITYYDTDDDPSNVQKLGKYTDTRLHNKSSELVIDGFIVLSLLRKGMPREFKTSLGRWHHSRDYTLSLQFN